MPQGGFGRDFQRAAVLKTESQKAKDKQEREKIGKEVISKITPYLDEYQQKIEEGLILKQDEAIAEFINMMKQRNTLLKFLLWTNVITLLGLSFALGYFL